MYVCHMCIVLMKTRRKHQTLWNWSYRQLKAATWVLGAEPQFSVRVASTFFFSFFGFWVFFETGFLCVALAVLELTL
jgi:hypothetical protein